MRVCNNPTSFAAYKIERRVKMRMRMFVSIVLVVAACTLVTGCGKESGQTSDPTPRTSQTSDEYNALREARRSGNRGDVHRELMKKTEGSRDVDDLVRSLKEAEEGSR